MVGRVVLNVLRAEIALDPLPRGYSAMFDDQAVTDSLNALDRPAIAGSGALFNYLARKQAKDIAAEPENSHILGRLRRVVDEGVIGSKTFDPGSGASVLTASGKDASYTLLKIAIADRLGSFTESLNAAEFQTLLQDVVETGVMKPGDRTKIIALSENRQSRASEIGMPRVRVGWVKEVRL